VALLADAVGLGEPAPQLDIDVPRLDRREAEAHTKVWPQLGQRQSER
jgi:hypothetical protein